MRHWSFTRMLCCPARRPFNPSSRLPGGTAISRNSVAACNCRSFRRAVRWMSVGNRRDTCPRKIFSVSAHAKLSIIAHTTLTHGVNSVKAPPIFSNGGPSKFDSIQNGSILMNASCFGISSKWGARPSRSPLATSRCEHLPHRAFGENGSVLDIDTYCIPAEARFPVVRESRALPDSEVRAQFRRVKPLSEISVAQRGWTLDVLNAIRRLVSEGRAPRDLNFSGQSGTRITRPSGEFTTADPAMRDLHPRTGTVAPRQSACQG